MATGVDGGDAADLVISLHRLVRSLRTTDPAAGLPPTQLVVLSTLVESGPLRLGALAARIHSSQPTTTAVVNGLESAALVAREQDPEDGRAIRVVLTAAGRARVRAVAEEAAGALAERLAQLSPGERAVLLAAGPVLRKLAGR